MLKITQNSFTFPENNLIQGICQCDILRIFLNRKNAWVACDLKYFESSLRTVLKLLSKFEDFKTRDYHEKVPTKMA